MIGLPPPRCRSPDVQPDPIALVLEDEREIRQFVRSSLESEGWQVVEAGTVKQGLIEAGTRPARPGDRRPGPARRRRRRPSSASCAPGRACRSLCCRPAWACAARSRRRSSAFPTPGRTVPMPRSTRRSSCSTASATTRSATSLRPAFRLRAGGRHAGADRHPRGGGGQAGADPPAGDGDRSTGLPRPARAHAPCPPWRAGTAWAPPAGRAPHPGRAGRDRRARPPRRERRALPAVEHAPRQRHLPGAGPARRRCDGSPRHRRAASNNASTCSGS